MKCDYCGIDLVEKDIQDSHNVPTYLFEGNRAGRSNQADKFSRHWLCEKCHKKYELAIRLFLQSKAKEFSIEYFKEDENGDTS